MKIMEWTCQDCAKKLDKQDVENYRRKGQYCCSGYQCGCYGMPVDPPVCLRCHDIGFIEYVALKLGIGV